jgi:hypothetical protein
VIAGRAAQRSGQAAGPDTILPFSALTGRAFKGTVAGAFSTAPLVASNSLPWQGQIRVVPSSLLMGHPACVQIELYAFSSPPAERLTTTLWSR